MASHKRIDLTTAYGQLIVLVFLPICVLAVVGAILVYYETTHASEVEQRSLATAVLMRYEPIIQQHLPQLLAEHELGEYEQSDTSVATETAPPTPSTNRSAVALRQQLPSQLSEQLHHAYAERHVQRVALMDASGQVLLSMGYEAEQPWFATDASGQRVFATDKQWLSGMPTTVGTAYGLRLPAYQGASYWLFVDMDDEPLLLARYRILLALAVTGLFTILLLLLSLNTYAKRWIAPIYEMRLHLQRTTADTLYQPMSVESDGELNLLQQDLVKTLRRLHGSFQELKDHAEQTEDDLRLAFDEMEMQNISIRNARDAAISTSQAKSAFLANISHELRTPLNSIDGFINLLARNPELTAQQDLYVQTIRKSSAHLLALVNDVLDFSKIEAGKLILDHHEFDLYDAIYDVADMLSPVAAEKGLRMAMLFYHDVPMQVMGDALRIKQVLTNLLGNAIKFTDTGEVVVRVSLDDERDNHLLIAVQDSGKGVSVSDQKLLFQSFSQGDPSITRQYGGTGLGLVISKQLTRLMGGDIGFYDNAHENIANQGSTFWFSIPAHVDVLDVPAGDAMPLPILSPLAHSTDEYHVLAWINHAASMQVLQASLRQLPIRLTQASSLPGALELLKEYGNRWDWVLVDGDAQEDMTALLKQIRLHYQGKLAVFGYQVGFDGALLGRYHASGLYEPLDKRQLYALLDTQPNQTKPQTDTLRWQGHTVLAVDDHLPNLLVLDALLSELGIRVLTANSGFDAIEMVSKQQASRDLSTHDNGEAQPVSIDLIFMDIQMPRMSGREAAEQIRQIEAGGERRIPIIALTAHGLSDERDKLMASGIDDYVGKPISQPQLMQILQKWLGQARTPNPTQLSSSHPHTQQQTQPHTYSQVVPSDASGWQSPDSDSLRTHQASSDSEVSGSDTHSRGRADPSGTNHTDEALAVIDWEDALTRSANKPDLAAKLMMMMIDSVPQERQALEQAWQDNDRHALAHISHRLLGASRYTGVPQLRQASQNLEDKCLLNVSHTTPPQFAMLRPSYEALLAALDNLQQADLSPWPQLNYHRLSEDDMTWKMI